MAKRRNNKTAQKKRPNRRPIRRRRAVVNRTPRLPPARGLMANVFRSIVQTAWDVAQGALTSSCGTYTLQASADPKTVKQDVDFGYLFAQGWRAKYAGLFKEAKIHRVETWFLPYASITDPGLYVFNVSDLNENSLDTDFGKLIGTPGTVVRKINEIGHRVWFPTEPSDREWQVLNQNHTFLTFVLSAAESAYWIHTYLPPVDTAGVKPKAVDTKVNASLAGKIIVDVHASFRGKGDGVTEITPCFCRKCTRLRANREYLNRLSSPSISERFEELEIPSPNN